ncbi:MAG: hypothetical protein DRN20_00890 [Thermoplasmata archaeon]|nr:MAG: hypothetical protein DRN20_00890 [Thermoplasmata archaeon]
MVKLRDAYCPDCGLKIKVDVENAKFPIMCPNCGSTLIISEKTEEKEKAEHEGVQASAQIPQQVPPQPVYFPHYPPPYHPIEYVEKRYQLSDRQLRLTVAVLLAVAGFLGIVFYASFFLYSTINGEIFKEITTNIGALRLSFSIIMLVSSIISIIGAKKAKDGSYLWAVLSSICAILSFGYGIGSVLGIVSLYLSITRASCFPTG